VRRTFPTLKDVGAPSRWRAGHAALFLLLAAADTGLLESHYLEGLFSEPKVARILARRVRANAALAELAVRYADRFPEEVTAAWPLRALGGIQGPGHPARAGALLQHGGGNDDRFLDFSVSSLFV